MQCYSHENSVAWRKYLTSNMLKLLNLGINATLNNYQKIYL